MLYYFPEKFKILKDQKPDIFMAIKYFDSFLLKKSGGIVKELCIFCAGRQGLRLYNELTKHSLPIKCFCDNNPEKTGYIIENIYCISLEQLKKIKDNILVIVANLHPKEILEQLLDLEFPYLLTRQEILPYIEKIPDLDYLKQVECFDSIDYNSPQTEIIIYAFRNIMADFFLQKLNQTEQQ